MYVFEILLSTLLYLTSGLRNRGPSLVLYNFFYLFPSVLVERVFDSLTMDNILCLRLSMAFELT